MELDELQRAIEAILFASGERIDIKRFCEVLEVDPDEVEKAATENTIRLFQLPVAAEDWPR